MTSADDIIKDMADCALEHMSENPDIDMDDAISNVIDDQLIYDDDILAVITYYTPMNDLYNAFVDGGYYDEFFSDIREIVDKKMENK